MSNEIIIRYQPFTYQQTVYVVGADGNFKETVYTSNDQMTNIIKGLTSNYEVETIKLIGNKDMLEKLKADLLTDFNIKAKIEIKGV